MLPSRERTYLLGACSGIASRSALPWRWLKASVAGTSPAMPSQDDKSSLALQISLDCS